MCMCMYMCMCIYMYVYVFVYFYICISMSRVCAVLFHLALGKEDGGVQLVYASACCLAWRVILTEEKVGVLFVSSPFFKVNAGGSVCECVCVYTHTHTHTA